MIYLFLLLSQVGGVANHGSGLSFDGVDDYVKVSDSASLDFGTNSFTVEAWIKRADNDINLAQVYGKRDGGTTDGAGWDFSIYDNKLRVDIRDGTNYVVKNPVGATAIDENWHHIAVVYDRVNGIAKVYLDWQQDGSDVDISSVTGSVNCIYDLRMGVRTTVDDGFFNGFIDNVRIYNRVLDSTEITWDYRHPSTPYDTTGLVLKLDFNEFTGDTAFDSSGQGNNGVIYGAKWTIESPQTGGKQ